MNEINPAAYIRTTGPLYAKVLARRKELIAAGKLREEAPETPQYINPFAVPRRQSLPHKSSTAYKVASIVADVYKVDLKEMLGSTRRPRKFAWPRHVSYAIVRMVSDLSFTQIATLFDCHHASVIHAVNVVKERTSSNPHLREDFMRALDRVRAERAVRL